MSFLEQFLPKNSIPSQFLDQTYNGNNDAQPFTILPKSATILPNDIQQFRVIFHPKNVLQYAAYLKSTIFNLVKYQNDLVIVASAKSLLPKYHFDIKPSNYFQRLSHEEIPCNDIDLNFELPQEPKVIEIETILLGVNIIR